MISTLSFADALACLLPRAFAMTGQQGREQGPWQNPLKTADPLCIHMRQMPSPESNCDTEDELLCFGCRAKTAATNSIVWVLLRAKPPIRVQRSESAFQKASQDHLSIRGDPITPYSQDQFMSRC